VPHHWIALDGNTPVPWDEVSGDPDAFYEQVEATVTRYHGTLLDMCWAIGKKRAYILVDGPEDPAEVKALAGALPTIDVVVLLTRDEVKRANGFRSDYGDD
jgi:hypothetical protein